MTSNQSEDSKTITSTSIAPTLEEIAFHEAGHTVIEFLLKIPFKKVSIIPDEETDTLGYVEGFPTYHQKLDPKTWKLKYVPANIEFWSDNRKIKFIKSLMAGGIAENILKGNEDIDLNSSDYENAINLAGGVCGSQDEVNALLTYLWWNTYNMMTFEANWFLVEALANLLLDQKSINGKFVKEFLKDKQAVYLPSIIKDTTK